MKSSQIHLVIVTPQKKLIDTSVDQVSIPTAMGEITILPHHVPVIAKLQFGELLAKKDGEDMPFALWGGVAEITGERVTILADTAQYAEEISLEKAEAARKKAEELMQKKEGVSEEEFAAFAGQLERALAQERVAQKYKTKKYRKFSSLEK